MDKPFNASQPIGQPLAAGISATYIPGLFAVITLVGVVGLTIFLDIPFGVLSRDPTATLSAPPYVGVLSQLGIFLWAATTAMCAFTLRLLIDHEGSTTSVSFLKWGFVLSLLLGLDDAFLVHESVPWPGEYLIFAAYGISVVYFFLKHHRQILGTKAACASELHWGHLHFLLERMCLH